MDKKKTIQNEHTDIFLDSFQSDRYIESSIILDVGCGDGYASKKFIDSKAECVYSLDPSTTLLTNERPNWISEEQNCFTKQWSDIDSLNIKFDLIWHHHVLEHVEDIFSFLRKIHSMLANDGEMWMACPNMAQHAIFSPGHIHNFQSAQLVDVLRRCGFAVGDISIWAVGGQIRVRVPKYGSMDYPEPMKKSLQETGRCPSDAISDWNWGHLEK